MRQRFLGKLRIVLSNTRHREAGHGSVNCYKVPPFHDNIAYYFFRKRYPTAIKATEEHMSVVPKLEATIMGDAGTADKLEAYTES